MAKSRNDMLNDPWLTGLGQRMLTGDYKGALAELLPAVQSPEASARVFELTIICFNELRDDVTARALAGVAVKAFPLDPWLWNQRARLDMGTGDTDAAIENLKRALKLDPDHLAALTSLSLLRPFEKGSANEKKLRKAIRQSTHQPRELANAHSALARIEERAGNHAVAFRHYQQCNGLRSGKYQPEGDMTYVDEQIAHFRALDDPIPDGPAPFVFVGGMPRSGTTLLETALLRHPAVESIGETPTLQRVHVRAVAMSGEKAPIETSWDWAERLSPEQKAELREELIAGFRQAGGPESTVLEKMPLACLRFGIAHHLLPEARFIFMDRHPLDCGLSNYVTNFERGYDFATRLDWIAAKMLAVERSAEDYAAKLGARFRTQSYRALVESPETQLRDVLTHIGLPWDAACLSPEQAERTQRTASMFQVREAINRRGLGKWRPYARQLAPLIKGLGGEDLIAQWEQRDESRLEMPMVAE